VFSLHARAAGRPRVRIRQRVRRRRGVGLVVGPLKSRHARRDLPIPLDLADGLQNAVRGQRDLAFANRKGAIVDPDNLAARVLRPACSDAGVEWAGFHTFRHTVASRLFAAGRNVVQVQRWLGHHSPSFTLDTYAHLLDGDLGVPLEPLRVNSGVNRLSRKGGKRKSAGNRRNDVFAGRTVTGGKPGQTRFRAHNPKVAGSNPAPAMEKPR
jgi:integrase-like protein